MLKTNKIRDGYCKRDWRMLMIREEHRWLLALGGNEKLQLRSYHWSLICKESSGRCDSYSGQLDLIRYYIF